MGTCVICDADIAVATENCPSCRSRPRIRTMAMAVADLDLPRDVPVRCLHIAPTSLELRILSPYVTEVVTSSLYGRYGTDHVTADLRDLAPFGDASFDLVAFCDVLDFIPETEDCLHSVARVLRPGGRLFFHYADRRLLPGDEAPRVVRYRDEQAADYYPEGYRQPVVHVGRRWLVQAWSAVGVSSSYKEYEDELTGRLMAWWFGIRSRPVRR